MRQRYVLFYIEYLQYFKIESLLENKWQVGFLKEFYNFTLIINNVYLKTSKLHKLVYFNMHIYTIESFVNNLLKKIFINYKFTNVHLWFYNIHIDNDI